MQSSTVVACRATVMIVCLVAVPWIAIFGTSWPQFLKRITRDGDGAATVKTLAIPGANRDAEKAAAYGPLTDAPPYVPGGAAKPAESPSASGGQAFPTDQAAGRGVLPAGNAGNRDLPASFDPGLMGSPAGGAARIAEVREPSPFPPRYVPASFESPLTPNAARSAAPEQPAGLVQPLPSGPERMVPVPRATPEPLPERETPATRGAPPTDRFTFLEQRLRALGATHYLLETWGQEGQLYRFQCQMAIGRTVGMTKYFEATDTSPFVAMERVLREVETWRARQGLPGRAG
jgi:hypothetical protein